MQPIQLTEEHKAKLLEMIKALFPEYKHISLSDIQLDIGGCNDEVNQTRWQPFIFYSELEKAPFDDGKFIHWFEFCMVNLYNALCLLNPSIDQNKLDKLWEIVIQNKIHPIDYLYEQFKKLK